MTSIVAVKRLCDAMEAYVVMVYNVDKEDEKRAFNRLTEKDKLFALYEVMSHNRNEQQAFMNRLVNIEKRQIEFDDDLIAFKQELRQVRQEREKREKKLVDLLDTDPKLKNLSSEEKQSLTEKFMAIATRRDDWMPIVKELIRVIILLIGLITASKFIP